MEKLQNKEIVLRDQDILTVDILTQYPTGKFRFISKTRLGMTCTDARSFDNERLMKYPESIISGYKKGTLQTVEFCPEGSTFYLTIFCRVGKKVKLINGLYYNTNLYNQDQYKTVNSTSWASKAFVLNDQTETELV